MTRSLSLLTALTIVATLGADLLAQGAGPVANRRVLSTAVVPGTAAGTFDVHVAWTIEVGGLSSVPLDLGTDIDLVVNGLARDSIGVVAGADAGAGDCGTCSAGCGTGYVDGVFNTLLCLEDGEGPTAGCECRFPSILGTFPGESLGPGDVIEVLLRPATGALPDAEPADDRQVLSFAGDPIGWDRRLVSVTTTPTAGAPDSFFDIWIEFSLSATGLAGEIDLTPVVHVYVDGVFAGAYEPPCGPFIAAPGGDCGLCDGQICGVIECDGQIVSEMRCQFDVESGSCGCTSVEVFSILVPGQLVEPGDDLDIKLVPVPGALPELPGFEDDEETDVGRWLDLGDALAGTHGEPVTVGEGTLLGGDPMTLTLTNALENTSAFLVVGFVDLSAPFKGGVLVPDPLLTLPFPTGAAGVIGLAAVWPLGVPSGFVTYFQWWIVDAAGPAGFAASNALSATAP